MVDNMQDEQMGEFAHSCASCKVPDEDHERDTVHDKKI